MIGHCSLDGADLQARKKIPEYARNNLRHQSPTGPPRKKKYATCYKKKNSKIMARKVMITGATGLLGRSVYAEFKKKNWEVLGLAFSRATGDLVKLDLNDSNAVRETIQRFKPHAIVHCAAERSPDKVEKDYEASRKLNVECSKNLAQFALEAGAVLIYISTDYVFDGTTPPYTENDVPNPLNQYGISKYEGEEAILDVYKESIILRIPVLYGDEEYLGESAVSSLIKNLLSDKPVKVSNYEIRFPSHTEDIAAICFGLAEKRMKDPSIKHVYHWAGQEALTKYDMVKIIGEQLKLSSEHVLPDDTPSTGAPRPKNTQLSCDKLKRINIGQHTKFSEGVAKSFAKFVQSC
ncbi:hypothetical protein JTE90_012460 [Oedothorax gibbosus]|uniref:Methionine adenosyltransferase 2 subunit beta n=1 Tax=Oedothorax gibbosus TaxID=931172 RepID=A0AAV6UGP1_9ARAC|nr:hypothetical protein JTE90_012460 [Oedothorax gibbosus]